VTAARHVVRLARADELDAAGRAVRAAYEEDGHAHGGYLGTLADARDRSLDAEVAVAVTPDGEIIGSVTLALPGSRWAERSTPGEAEFRMLGVLPAARGLGAGGALVDWCVGRARELGCHRLILSTLPQMAPAHRLYTARGFVRSPDLDWVPVDGVLLLGYVLGLAADSDRHDTEVHGTDRTEPASKRA
jgi:GNAT superfamily N-acetyltransferase